MVSYKKDDSSPTTKLESLTFPRRALGNPASTITGAQHRFTIIDAHVLRYEWAEDGRFEDRPSTFVIARNFPKPEFRVKESDDQLEISTSTYHLVYDKQRFSPNGLVVSFLSKVTDAEWRFGEDPDENNLGGTARTLDEVNGRCDMGLGILSKSGYGVLDDSKSMLFDDRGFVSPRRTGDRIDGYLFSYGRDYMSAMESFYAISGRQPVVPRWSLGNWWSRYYAYDHVEYLDLMRKFQDNGVPLSVAVMDMDWHWVKQDFVPHSGWTGYSWNTDLFPNPKAFTSALHQMRLRMTLNDHPSAGIHHHEDVYDEAARALGHDTSHKDPIPFDPTSPDFMHVYFDIVHRRLEEQGCDFWWTDWQQGTHSRIPGFDPLWLLNHFQYLDTQKSQPHSAPLIFSRYAGPGSHRYPVGFSGDTVATWASLQFQPEFTATASNIGFGWWSHDIGGHLPGSRDDECATRWVQLGVFSPILRLHSTHSQWMSKEPWLYRSEHAAAMRDAMQLRHRLVPYIYSVNASSISSLPLVQPLYWRFPQVDSAYSFPNQYYFGPSLLISPIVTPRDPRTNLAQVRTWIPPHRHVDLFTGTVYDGERAITLFRPLQQLPVLLSEGSILPLDNTDIPRNGCPNPPTCEVLLVVGRDAHFELREDPRDDPSPPSPSSPSRPHRSVSLSYTQSTGRLTCHSTGSGKSAWTFRFLALHRSAQSPPIRTQLNTEPPALHHHQTSISTSISTSPSDPIITIPTSPDGPTALTIDLGSNPTLALRDPTESLRTFLRDTQIDFRLKDSIWKILEAPRQTPAARIAQILSLGLDEEIHGPIVELLSADARVGVVEGDA